MRGSFVYWICSICTFMFVNLAMGDSNSSPPPQVNNENSAYDYAKLLERIGSERILQLQQQLLHLQQLQVAQKQQQRIPDRVTTQNLQPPQAQIPSPYASYLNSDFVPQIEPITKRSPHQIQQRAVNQFKNCYFSPVQCVLLERRRRSLSSFA